MIRARHPIDLRLGMSFTSSFVIEGILVGFLSFAAVQATGSEALKAVSDGKLDASVQLQAAIDAGHGSLVIPSGRYRLEKSLVIQLAGSRYCHLRGEGGVTLVMASQGPAIRLIGSHMKSADPANFSDSVWQRERMPLLESLAIEGNHDDATGIEALGTMQMTVSRMHFRKLKHGIHLIGSNRNILIDSCHIYENRGIGIFYDNVDLHQSNIVGCHISYCDEGGIVSRKGNVRNIHISGCDIESNMGKTKPPTANILIDSRDSAAGTAEVAITGCTIQHNNTSPESCNIRILGGSKNSRSGVANREGYVTITGNVLSDVATNIHLDNCRSVALTGNTLWMGFEHNLLIENCSHIVLGANNLDRNPRYDYGTALSARNAVIFRNCEACTVTGLHITHVSRSPAGLVLENCRRMNVSGTTILDCDNAGILAKNVTESTISNCLIAQSDPNKPYKSLVVEGGSANRFDIPPAVAR